MGKILDKLIEQAIKKRYHFAREVLGDLNQDLNEIRICKHESTLVPPPQVPPQYRQESIQFVTPHTVDIPKNQQQDDTELLVLRIIASCIAIPYGVVTVLTSLGGLISGSGTVFSILIVPFLITCCAILSKNIAKSKNRDQLLWFLLGFPFHFVAVLIIACLPIRD